MARPTDNSLKYYNQDTKDDDNLQYVEAMHGLPGYAIVHKLWKHIYGGPGGYYCEWSNINKMLFCKNNAIDIQLLEEVLATCYSDDIKIFDKNLSDSLQILTSKGIQKRWSKIVKEAGRKISMVKEIHRLICLEGDTLPVTHQETTPPMQLIGEETTQSKVKQSIVNEIKETNIGANELPPQNPVLIESVNEMPLVLDQPTAALQKKNTRAEKFIAPTEDEAYEFFVKIIGSPKKPGYWPAKKCQEQASIFYNHYNANGWKQSNGLKLVDWHSAAHNWITRERTGKFDSPVQQPDVPAAVSIKTGSKDERELNYLYERWCEDASKVTVLSIDALHYDYLKRCGLVTFTTDDFKAIAEAAKQYMQLNAIEETNETVMKFKKRFGVLQFFKEKCSEGLESIFMPHESKYAS
ncbi:MAG: hypothetical protein JWR61_5658 [Ferruginibacter sp.]|uniref:DUF4373 domain-containing protein n=1 Tax=Ferruginibacter sp. TaxID=1940288 RepID=UPI00265AD0C9|nr:DUF4373 domain-containing protein [Ferruginibacter sp.]MDB5280703.1 hypothetical protein [Ferruginibacter sp.]